MPKLRSSVSKTKYLTETINKYSILNYLFQIIALDDWITTKR